MAARRDGRHEAALRLQYRAKKLHERAHGARHHEVGRDLSHIGNCLCDLGRLDAHGWLTLADRKKDMILFGGENVYSAEVERVIQEHPAVDMVSAATSRREPSGQPSCCPAASRRPPSCQPSGRPAAK